MKKTLKGIIVSNKMQETVVVRVERIKEHPRYKRRYKVHKKYKAHAKIGEYKIGDKVIIEECRPISKEKRWRVVKKITSHIGRGSGKPFGCRVASQRGERRSDNFFELSE